MAMERTGQDAAITRLPTHVWPSEHRRHDSYKSKSQAATTAMARAELNHQRKLNDESPRIEAGSNAMSNDFIIPVQLPEPDGEGTEGDSCVDDYAVVPEDSLSGRARIGKRKDQSKICEREMVELRRLVQSDDRFGFALERTCQAVHECISTQNSSPVLALLASLVWRSLCLAWELEPQNKMAKAHLRSKIAGLEDEHKHTVESFDEARAKYLKELVVLRDQVRARDGHYLAAIHKVVHEEEPVIFYEPMKYLEETTRAHVVDIVEEKLKQLIATLKDLPYIPPERKVEQTEEEPLTPIISKPKREPRSRKPSEDMQSGAALAAAEAAVGRVTKMLEESQARTEHLEK